jgi:hypothetical protein
MSDQIIITEQTEKMCPFAGMSITDSTDGISTASGVKCIKSQCQLWVANTETADPFTQIVSQNNAEPVAVDAIAGTVDGGRCGAQVSDYNENIFRLIHHYHRHHEHPYAHFSPVQLPTSNGGPFFNKTTPKSFMLSVESDTNEDQDGNGKILNKDFGILIDDNTPNSIKNMYNPGSSLPPVLVPWNDYIQNIYRPYYKSSYPNRLNVEGGYIRVTGGFFSADAENFELTIEIGNPDNDISYQTLIVTTDYRVKSSSVILIKIPSFVDHEYFVDNTDVYLNLKITNSGNTFDQDGFLDNFTDTGGLKLVENALKLDQTVNNETTQTKLEEEWNSLE